MKKKSIIAIIAVCAAIGAAIAAIILFHDEMSDFVKKIISKLERIRDLKFENDCCCDGFDDFDDFEDFDDVF